jgi:hypothetical protein
LARKLLGARRNFTTLPDFSESLSEKPAPRQLPRSFSDMKSEKGSDHKDHNHYADDVENIHCVAPIGRLTDGLPPYNT